MILDAPILTTDQLVAFGADELGSRDVASVAEALGRPVIHDASAALWAVGPPARGRYLEDARMPSLVLPDLDGRPFDLASLRGMKVLLLAWSPW